MKILFRLSAAAAVVLFLSVETASAQRTHGYVFAAPGVGGFGATEGLLHAGAGAELGLPMSFGVGAELGVVGSFKNIRNVDETNAIGSLSLYRHFSVPGPVGPYVFGGYSKLLRGGAENGFNFGLGANVSPWGRLGFKFEFRGHSFSSTGGSGQLWQGRIGLIF